MPCGLGWPVQDSLSVWKVCHLRLLTTWEGIQSRVQPLGVTYSNFGNSKTSLVLKPTKPGSAPKAAYGTQPTLSLRDIFTSQETAIPPPPPRVVSNSDYLLKPPQNEDNSTGFVAVWLNYCGIWRLLPGIWQHPPKGPQRFPWDCHLLKGSADILFMSVA